MNDKQTYFGLGGFAAIVLIATLQYCAKQYRAPDSPRAVTKPERDFAADCMRYKVGSAEECRDVARDLFEGACPELPPVLVELDENGVPVSPMCDCSAEDWTAYEEGRAHGMALCEMERRLP